MALLRACGLALDQVAGVGWQISLHRLAIERDGCLFATFTVFKQRQLTVRADRSFHPDPPPMDGSPGRTTLDGSSTVAPYHSLQLIAGLVVLRSAPVERLPQA